MKPLPTPLKAAAMGLASLFTLANAVWLHVALRDSWPAPVPVLAETEIGCDLDPSRHC